MKVHARLAYVALGAVLVSVAPAIAPEGNLVDNKNTNAALIAADVFNPVVRISTNLGGGNFSVGSGTVFDKHTRIINNVTHYYLCVLTADHVIAQSPGSVKIDFQNYYFDNGTGVPPSGPLGGTFSSFVTGRGINGIGLDTPDIAVLGTEVNQAIYTTVFTPGVVGFNSSDNGKFSLVSYGNTGNRIVDGSGNRLGFTENTLSYGTKRFLNGTATQGANQYNDGTYVYDQLVWGVGATGGTAFHGDSGGGMFYSNLNNVSANSTDKAFATFVGGVLTGGSIDAIGNIYNNGTNWGVDLTDYQTWIEEKCAAVPEPTSVLAMGIGLALMLRLRRKK